MPVARRAVAEDFGFELPQRRTVFPCVEGQAGLAARLFDERPFVPLPFDRHLWKKQSALPSPFHDETVTTDFDLTGSCRRLERTKNRQFDLDAGQLGDRDG